MSSPRLTPGLLGALAGAIVCLWLGYAVVAGVSDPSPPGSMQELPMPDAAPIDLALSPAPGLRVRAALLRPARVPAIAQPQPQPQPQPDPEPARPAPSPSTAMATAKPTTTPTPAPVPTSAPAPATPAPMPAPTETKPAQPPVARPHPKPQPTLKAQPKRPARPDFDESAPSGFDNSG